MTDRLTEIKARVANFPYGTPLLSDLEYALGEIERLDAINSRLRLSWREDTAELATQRDRLRGEIERLHDISAFNGLTEQVKALSAERDRLRAALQKLVDFTDGKVADYRYKGELFSANLCRQYADEGREAIGERKS